MIMKICKDLLLDGFDSLRALSYVVFFDTCPPNLIHLEGVNL